MASWQLSHAEEIKAVHKLHKNTKYYLVSEQQTKTISLLSPRMSKEQQAVARARKAFETGRSKSLEHRIRQLKNLQRLFIEKQSVISDAIKKDLNKVSSEMLFLTAQNNQYLVYNKLESQGLRIKFRVCWVRLLCFLVCAN